MTGAPPYETMASSPESVAGARSCVVDWWCDVTRQQHARRDVRHRLHRAGSALPWTARAGARGGGAARYGLCDLPDEKLAVPSRTTKERTPATITLRSARVEPAGRCALAALALAPRQLLSFPRSRITACRAHPVRVSVSGGWLSAV